MTHVPYPSFVHKNPVDARSNRCGLPAVGRCRIYPGLTSHHYRDIVTKNQEQARMAHDEAGGAKVDKLKKKSMKEGVAMAKNYLVESLQLDVSVVDVEVMVQAEDLVTTDGCLAACFLDAGCDKIVTNGNNIEALDCTKIPKDRLVGHFLLDDFHCLDDEESTIHDDRSLSSTAASIFADKISSAANYVNVISIELTQIRDITEQRMMEIVELFSTVCRPTASTTTKDKPCVKLVIQFNPKDAATVMSQEEIAAMVGFVSKVGTVSISLVDPSAAELGLSFAACMKTDRKDDLYTTVVCSRNGEALGLVYSSKESIVAALESGRGVYYSRSRQGLWRKGDTSGHYQVLHRLDVDCDGDALRFTVTQKSAFCHLGTLTCWGKPRGIAGLQETLQDRFENTTDEKSYTRRLFDDSELLRDKLVEEAQELSEATEPTHVAEELADVLYFAMVRATAAGVTLDDAISELDKRARKVTRRKGDSKAYRINAANTILDKQNVIDRKNKDSHIPSRDDFSDQYSKD